MREIHPLILRREGKNAFVILTWEEFEAIEEALENAEDLRILREARDADTDEPSLSQEEMEREFGVGDGSDDDQSSGNSETP